MNQETIRERKMDAEELINVYLRKMPKEKKQIAAGILIGLSVDVPNEKVSASPADPISV